MHTKVKREGKPLYGTHHEPSPGQDSGLVTDHWPGTPKLTLQFKPQTQNYLQPSNGSKARQYEV